MMSSKDIKAVKVASAGLMTGAYQATRSYKGYHNYLCAQSAEETSGEV